MGKSKKRMFKREAGVFLHDVLVGFVTFVLLFSTRIMVGRDLLQNVIPLPPVSNAI